MDWSFNCIYHTCAFYDTSVPANDTCFYARHTVENSTEINLICSRNKLDPVKKVTLPRLELLVALLGPRLLEYFCRETNMHSYTAILCNDSTVDLSWIKEDPNNFRLQQDNGNSSIHNSSTMTPLPQCRQPCR
ncbi:reverse transcriptase domain-containing protein [Nephila pilipes]|uniref:Reverse transcriptase domain-containing protein n=1 Tax=Nephila pilipes TaxID=299642 RepID=A0A8X6TE10_NEPPI|nr:reverse transcriptase domain-containing protein [Nephila pilipes]